MTEPAPTFHLVAHIVGAMTQGSAATLKLTPQRWATTDHEVLAPVPVTVPLALGTRSVVELRHPGEWEPAWQWAASLTVEGVQGTLHGLLEAPPPGQAVALSMNLDHTLTTVPCTLPA